MKRRPLILISGSTDRRAVEFQDAALSLSTNYPRAIQAAGGLPWVLPCLPERAFVAESVRRCDGVLLTGGDDVNPDLYRADLPADLRRTVHPAAPERDLLELLLVDEVFRWRRPLLAICRGHQLLNVALGGTLVVDIARQMPGMLEHRRLDRKDQIVHEVEVTVGSILARVAGAPRLGVNSSHHQAIEKIAKVLRVSGRSTDGIIEGVELRPEAGGLLPYLAGVQFHPERLFERHPTHLELFRSFIGACAGRARQPQ